MAKRSITVLAATVIVVAAIVVYLLLYLTNVPPTYELTRAQGAQTVNLYMATVPAAELSDPHPSWVSYYVTSPQDTNWKHTTMLQVPAHTLVHMTVYQYDGDSGLRNPFLSQAQGTVGGTMNVDGQTTQTIDPDDASHVFAIPQLGVSVPLKGVDDDAKNQCANAPCTMAQAHQTITFTFRTGAKGLFRWQCFVPCAAGFISGWGGPMQTVGYMDGFLKVV